MVLLDEKSTRRTESAVIAISSSVFALCLQIYGYTRPWYDWGRIASLPISAGFAIAGLILAQEDIRANRRQKQTQSVNDDIYSCGLESYRTTTMEEIVGSRQPSPDYYMGEVLTVDALPQPEPETLEVYDWANIVDDASGCIVAGPSGYGKTSIGAGVLVGWFTKEEPAEVIALDIHASRNKIWGDLNYPRVIDSAYEIYRICKWLIDEIETRKRQDRHNLIVLLDEVNDLLAELDHMDGGKKNGEKSTVVTYCIRKLSNARKFGITLIVFGQSHNVSALGIDGKFRNNFSLIFVGESARQEILQEMKKDSLEYQSLKQTAYPCAVSGNLPVTVAIHPTHGDYTKYKKKGNAPNHLVKPNFILDNWLIPGGDRDRPVQPTETHRPNPSEFNLEKDPEPPVNSSPKISEGEALAVKILEWCIAKGGEITLKILKDNTRWARKFTDEVLLSAFSALQENGLAEYIIEEKKAGNISHVLRAKLPN